MKRAFGAFFLFVVTLTLPSLDGESAARDLGEGLVYVRATVEPDSVEFVLPAVPSEEGQGQSALIFDLRYVEGEAGEARQLSEWLSAHANTSPGTAPVFFLVNAETALALREVAVEFAQSYPALLIGTASAEGGGVLPDIVLEIDAGEERAAHAILASGEPDVGSLIGEAATANKRRYDEAAVIAAHASPEPERRLTRAASTEPPPEVTGARPVDLALQRAIHLHRAWRIFAPHSQP